MTHSLTPNSPRDPGRWMVLLACIIAMLMVAIDAGILNLVVPAIQAEFNPPQSTISCFVLLCLGLKPQPQSQQQKF